MSRRRSILYEKELNIVHDPVVLPSYVFSFGNITGVISGAGDNHRLENKGGRYFIPKEQGILARASYTPETAIELISGTGRIMLEGNTVVTISEDGSFTIAVGGAPGLATGQFVYGSVTYTAKNLDTEVEGTGTISFSIVGENTPPYVSTPIPDKTARTSETVSYSVGTAFKDDDPGHTETLSYTFVGLPTGFSSTGGTISGKYARDAHILSPYIVTVTASDTAGATASTNFKLIAELADIVAENKSPAAITADSRLDVAPTSKYALLTNVTTTASGTVDLTGAQVTKIGTTDIVGTPSVINPPLGGTLTVNPDGSYSFTTDNDFDDVSNGTIVTPVSLDYTVENDLGATSTKRLTIKVSGTLKTPTFSPPKLTFTAALQSGNTDIIGSTVTYKFTVTIDKGSITLSGSKQDNRSGDVLSIALTGEQIAGTITDIDNSGSTVTYTVTKTYVVGTSVRTFTATGNYADGPIPLDSRDRPLQLEQLKAASFDTITRTIPAGSSWPYYGTVNDLYTDGIPILIGTSKLSELSSDSSGKYIEVSMSGQDVSDNERIKFLFPADWGELKGLKTKDHTGTWVWKYSIQERSLSDFKSPSVVEHTVGGGSYSYREYVAKDEDYSLQLVRLYFNG
jgi:VCBS repeat-containing protein